jgi:hypothetical protein
VQNATVLRDVEAEIADAQARLAELDQLREVVTERLADLNRLRASASADRRKRTQRPLPSLVRHVLVSTRGLSVGAGGFWVDGWGASLGVRPRRPGADAIPLPAGGSHRAEFCLDAVE